MRSEPERLREKRKSKSMRREFADHLLTSTSMPQCEIRYKTKKGRYRLTIDGQNVGLDLPKSLAFDAVVQAKDGDVQKAFEWVCFTDPWLTNPWDGGEFGRLTQMIWRKFVLSDEASYLGDIKFRVVDGKLMAHRARRNPVRPRKFLYTNEVLVKSNLPSDFEIREGFTAADARSI